MEIFISLLITAILSFISILISNPKKHTSSNFGLSILSIIVRLAILSFWTLVGYVIYHFISKYW